MFIGKTLAKVAVFLTFQDLILIINCITFLPGVHYHNVICNSVAQTPALFHLFTMWQKCGKPQQSFIYFCPYVMLKVHIFLDLKSQTMSNFLVLTPTQGLVFRVFLKIIIQILIKLFLITHFFVIWKFYDSLNNVLMKLHCSLWFI